MAKLTKRQKALAGKVETTKLYPLDNAISLVKECATAKFDESIDVVCHLAALAGVRPSLAEPVRYARTNVEGTAIIIERMRRTGRSIVRRSMNSVTPAK